MSRSVPRPLAFCLAVLFSTPVVAQTGTPTNGQVLEDLAVACLPPVSGSRVGLTAPSRLPFLGSAILTSLQTSGLEVVTAQTPDVAQLTLDLQRAGVRYERAGSGNLARTVELVLAVRLISQAGVVERDAVCSPSETDLVARAAIATLEDPTYPETRGQVPLTRWRRLIQPAVITAATAVGTVLFFSLRSRRADGS